MQKTLWKKYCNFYECRFDNKKYREESANKSSVKIKGDWKRFKVTIKWHSFWAFITGQHKKRG